LLIFACKDSPKPLHRGHGATPNLLRLCRRLRRIGLH